MIGGMVGQHLDIFDLLFGAARTGDTVIWWGFFSFFNFSMWVGQLGVSGSWR